MKITELTQYADALRLAERCHKGQVRKGTGEPYIQHPVRVAALLIEADQSIETVAAGLLHDTMEDSHLERAVLAEIMGEKVTRIVETCTEPGWESKLTWRERKRVMMARAAEAEPEACAVLAADKSDNLGATYAMIAAMGRKAAWRRLKMSRTSQRWYHTGMLQALKGRTPERLERLYAEVIEEVFENEENDDR